MSSPVDILLVDDESRNLDALEAMLTNPEYRLLRAADADTALRTLLENDVAAIVLDIQLPGISGFDLAQTIKTTKRFRETPIVFLTAYLLDPQHVLQGYGAGAVDYLVKPVIPQILRQKIGVFAELHRKTRALAELNERLEDRVKERTAELERSEAALRDALRIRDEFLTIASHELKTPLTALQLNLNGAARIAGQNGNGSSETLEKIRDRLSRTMRGAERLERLVEELLDISRITTGRLTLVRESMDLGEAVTEVVDRFREAAQRAGSQIDVRAEPIPAESDRTRIEQIVANLVSNAVKYGNGRPIQVSLVRHHDTAVLMVRDQGIGITPDDQLRIFDRFERAVSQRHYGGFGLGLWIVRQIVDALGGDICVESTPSEGATFTVRLPLDLSQRADGQPRSGEPASTTPIGSTAPRP
jgi:signal transduction histidine kinase